MPTPTKDQSVSKSSAPAGASDVGERTAKEGGAAAPTGRPHFLLRALIEHLWIIVLPAWLGLFLFVVHLTNKIDLSELPAPRLLQLLAAAAILAVILGIPYLLFRTSIETAREDLMLRRDAELAVKDAERRLRRYGDRLTAEARANVEGALADLNAARDADRSEELAEALGRLDQALTAHLSFARKGASREYVESIGVAVLIALFLRAFVVEAFKIPSGSMIPTLQVGDHIFVNKFIFGARIPFTNIKLFHHLRPPRRGEVIVFIYPENPEKDFIKRIVGVPGDTVQVCGPQVMLNGKPLRREPVPGPCEYDDYDEDHPLGSWHKVKCLAYREWNGNETYVTVHNDLNIPQVPTCGKEWQVTPDHLFVMGDNRDNSHDSRYWGLVPYENIKGKAWFIWWSAAEKSSVRLNRMFDSIHHQ
jgi:signal peptidase I